MISWIMKILMSALCLLLFSNCSKAKDSYYLMLGLRYDKMEDGSYNVGGGELSSEVIIYSSKKELAKWKKGGVVIPLENTNKSFDLECETPPKQVYLFYVRVDGESGRQVPIFKRKIDAKEWSKGGKFKVLKNIH